MRRLLTILLLAAGIAPVRAMPCQEAKTGLLFPESIGTLNFKDAVVFEKTAPGAGTGFYYVSTAGSAVFNVYNANLPVIPIDASSPLWIQQLQNCAKTLMAEQAAGRSHDVKVLQPREMLSISGQPFLHASMGFEKQDGPQVVHFFLTACKNNFVRIQYTYPRSAAAEEEQNLQSLHAALAALFAH